MLSKSLRCAGPRRCLSSVVAADPKSQIMQGFLAIKETAAATDEATLLAASSAIRVIDKASPQAALEGFEEYLKSQVKAAGITGYKANTNLWQNGTYAAFCKKDFAREESWPFLVAGFVTFLLLGLYLPYSMDSPEGRRQSKYLSRLEGRAGVIEPKPDKDHPAAPKLHWTQRHWTTWNRGF